MNFRLSKTKKHVTLFLVGRSPMTGNLYLNDYCEAHHGAERVTDLLENAERFFMFESDDGRIWHVQKETVIKVIVDADYELEILRSYGIDALIHTAVIINLNDGHEEHGTLLIEPREGSSRLIDDLNRGKNFLSLVTGDRVHILGFPYVVTIRETT